MKLRTELAVLLSLSAAWAGGGPAFAQTVDDGPHCVSLHSEFDGAAGFEELLTLELDERDVTQGSHPPCARILVEALADEVAVVELADRRSRVVDLTPVPENLRARSLALAIAEEVYAFFALSPGLRAAPIPDEDPPAPRVVPEPEPGPEVVPDREPSLTTHAAAPSPNLLLGAGVDHLFVGSETLATVRAGIELPLMEGSLGHFQGGVELAFGRHQTGSAGMFDSRLAGGWIAWSWRVFGAGAVSLRLAPELMVGAAWLAGRQNDAVVFTDADALTFYLRATLAMMLCVRVTHGFAFEVGPSFGGLPLPVEVREAGREVDGLSGFLLGGRLTAVIAL